MDFNSLPFSVKLTAITTIALVAVSLLALFFVPTVPPPVDDGSNDGNGPPPPDDGNGEPPPPKHCKGEKGLAHGGGNKTGLHSRCK